MVLGFFYKFLAGSVITTFAVYPALADPKSFKVSNCGSNKESKKV